MHVYIKGLQTSVEFCDTWAQSGGGAEHLFRMEIKQHAEKLEVIVFLLPVSSVLHHHDPLHCAAALSSYR